MIGTCGCNRVQRDGSSRQINTEARVPNLACPRTRSAVTASSSFAKSQTTSHHIGARFDVYFIYCLARPLYNPPSKAMQNVNAPMRKKTLSPPGDNETPTVINWSFHAFVLIPSLSSMPFFRCSQLIYHAQGHEKKQHTTHPAAADAFIGTTSGSGLWHRDHQTSWARSGGCRRQAGCGRTGRGPA